MAIRQSRTRLRCQILQKHQRVAAKVVKKSQIIAKTFGFLRFLHTFCLHLAHLYIESHQDELEHNGYFLCKGKTLKEFKIRFAQDIDVPNKTPQIGLFDFHSFLNIGMLLTESERAKWVRARILDIVIATINEKTGGGTKYINRRDREYLPAAIQEENYHKNLTEAVNKYVDGHKTYKYAQVMDAIYKAVFCEKAKEYRKLLDLGAKDNVRRTLYAEVLRVVSSFENGVAFEITRQAKERGVPKFFFFSFPSAKDFGEAKVTKKDLARTQRSRVPAPLAPLLIISML